jgi:dTDP-glucose 4,6-dehydratase
MFVQAYHKTYNLNASITRCTNNFGPYQFPEKLIPKTIIRAIKNLPIPIYGTGKNIRDWIYVLDHCEALDLVLRDGKAGEVYNMAGGNELENIKVVERILEIMDKPGDLIEFVDDRPGHDVRYSLNCDKVRGRLGWEPKHTLPESLRKTVEWYLENEDWWRPLSDDRVLHPTPWKLRW